MIDIIIATGNRHKFRELAALLAIPGICWRSLAEFPSLPSIRETGRTFDANAVKKAVAVAKATGHLALADDSGIEVDALDGAPGVRSARFAGSHGDDEANNLKILRLLDGVTTAKRGAQYRCSLALADRSGALAVTRGIWRGQIATTPQGHRGFGYDPIVLIPRYSKTVAQLPSTVKQRLSHRAMAARRMLPVLKRLVSVRASVSR